MFPLKLLNVLYCTTDGETDGQNNYRLVLIDESEI